MREHGDPDGYEEQADKSHDVGDHEESTQHQPDKEAGVEDFEKDSFQGCPPPFGWMGHGGRGSGGRGRRRQMMSMMMLMDPRCGTFQGGMRGRGGGGGKGRGLGNHGRGLGLNEEQAESSHNASGQDGCAQHQPDNEADVDDFESGSFPGCPSPFGWMLRGGQGGSGRGRRRQLKSMMMMHPRWGPFPGGMRGRGGSGGRGRGLGHRGRGLCLNEEQAESSHNFGGQDRCAQHQPDNEADKERAESSHDVGDNGESAQHQPNSEAGVDDIEGGYFQGCPSPFGRMGHGGRGGGGRGWRRQMMSMMMMNPKWGLIPGDMRGRGGGGGRGRGFGHRGLGRGGRCHRSRSACSSSCSSSSDNEAEVAPMDEVAEEAMLDLHPEQCQPGGKSSSERPNKRHEVENTELFSASPSRHQNNGECARGGGLKHHRHHSHHCNHGPHGNEHGKGRRGMWMHGPPLHHHPHRHHHGPHHFHGHHGNDYRKFRKIFKQWHKANKKAWKLRAKLPRFRQGGCAMFDSDVDSMYDVRGDLPPAWMQFTGDFRGDASHRRHRRGNPCGYGWKRVGKGGKGHHAECDGDRPGVRPEEEDQSSVVIDEDQRDAEPVINDDTVIPMVAE